MIKEMLLSASLLVPAAPAFAAKTLNSAQLDQVTAGTSLDVAASTLSSGVNDSAAGTSTAKTFSNSTVFVGHAKAVASGTDTTAITSATPVLGPNDTFHSETHTNTTGTGVTHSQTNAVVHAK